MKEGAEGLRGSGLGAAGETRRGRGDERRHPEMPARRQRLPGALPGRVSGGEGRGGAGEGRPWRLPLPGGLVCAQPRWLVTEFPEAPARP